MNDWPPTTMASLEPQASSNSEPAHQQKQTNDPPQLTLAEVATVFDDSAAADAIFICIDCEAWEYDEREINEVGVSVLDTRDIPPLEITSLDAEAAAESIISKMKYAHYRPVEYAHHTNKDWVPGCPDSFGFGNSTWIRVADGKTVLQRIFSDPTRLGEAADFSVDIAKQERTLVFVGHGANDDDKFMQTLGFSMADVHGIEAAANTQRLVSWFRTGLGQLLAATGFQARNLHNGGNDAAYTLQVLIKAGILEAQKADCLGELLQKCESKGKTAAIKDSSIRAPVVWQGTAMEGDEVRLAINYKTGKKAAFKRRAIAKKEKAAKRAQKKAEA